jgi:hypothetical protein
LYKPFNKNSKMKQQILKSAMAFIALPVLFSLSSCDKDSDTKNTTPVTELGKVTVKGNISGDLDLNNGTLSEGMEGITVTVVINNQDLINNYTIWYWGNVANGYRTYSATTDALGNYSVDVEAGSKPLNATIYTAYLVNANQKNELGVSSSKTFYNNTGSSIGLNLFKGQSYTQNFEYRSNITPEVGTMSIKGDVRFRNDLCVVGDAQYSQAPANTKLLVEWNDDWGRNKQVTLNVDANGKYEFACESYSNSKGFYIRGVQFNADRKTNPGMGCTPSNYTYTLFGGGSAYTPVNKGEIAVRNYDFQ